MPAAAVKVPWRGDRGETGTVFGLLSGETANLRDAARQGLVVRVSAKCVRGLGETRSLRVFRTELPPMDAERNRVASPDA
jgi:hypothetical protein